MEIRNARKITTLLLRWFEKNKRRLPWRETNDPYQIWVSEIMLQQTQVATVTPYYERWMKRFPDLESLAKAPLSKVLKAWEGLGYYSRARHFHRAARMVLKDFDGKIPDSVDRLRSLPGIGRYTAGAIASIAFNQSEPVLDGNVKRVLSRFFALKEAVDTQAGERKLWEISKDLVGAVAPGPFSRRPCPYGDFNQALMELGALICIPEGPRCSLCPVSKFCAAHKLGREEHFPRRSRREKIEPLRTVAAIVRRNGKLLLRKQPDKGRWGGLWVFPHWTVNNGEDEVSLLRKNIRKELGMELEKLSPRLTVQHGFTKYRVQLRTYEGRVASETPVILRRLGGPTKNPNWRSFVRLRRAQDDGTLLIRWLSPSQISQLPLPRPHQKIAQSVQAHA